MDKIACPLALFDSLKCFDTAVQGVFCEADYAIARGFLASYQGSVGTFNSYRREVERLLHWSWVVAHKRLPELKRDDIEAFVRFCQRPPVAWVGTNKVARFIVQNTKRVPNPAWRPFVATVSKAKHQLGQTPEPLQFELSQGAIKECFAILGSFFNYCLQEEYVQQNPVALVRQKSQFIRRQQGSQHIRRLSDTQWQMVMHVAKTLADLDPDTHERTLFIMSALYSMYLRISELAASERWEPIMAHFYRDSDDAWWFSTVGKGNKSRDIAVSDAMLQTLKRWRRHLGLTSLPTPADTSPLLPKIRGQGPMKSTNHLRRIIQRCFDKAIEKLKADGQTEEAEALSVATVHWLRHTGISDDVKHRPREHVRDDAGHASSATTDKYIDIELKARHRSKRKRSIESDN